MLDFNQWPYPASVRGEFRPKPVEVILPFWDFLRKQEPGDVAVAVPLNYDVGQATYPDASFESFATEGYGKSEIVHACIRELAVSAASPRYYVQAPATAAAPLKSPPVSSTT